jgi:hypothetical protein
MVAVFLLTKIVEKIKPPVPPKMKYGKWSYHIPAQEGYSHELVSVDSYKNLELGKIKDLDMMVTEPYPGVNTIFKAMLNNLERYPDKDLLGTKVKGKYEWLTWK